MVTTLQNMWQEDWLLYHKVIFDGENRLVILNNNEPVFNAKVDIYSSWKEWTLLRDNSKFEPAFRVTGGDPVGGGTYTGDVYFTINNWRILLQDTSKINGVIYSDNYDSPYVTATDTKLVINNVSSLVQSLGFEGTVTISPNVTAADVWNYLLADANVSGSVGARISKLLTLANFLGLK